MALIRYPGSKAKLVKQILSRFPFRANVTLPLFMSGDPIEYREPFFGAGAVGFEVLRRLPGNCTAWINDADLAIVHLWHTVQNDHLNLIRKIEDFRPNVDAYEKFKTEDGSKDLDVCESGFRKLALHQMSFSGLGYMSGGPLGGIDQENAFYRIDCRWVPSRLIKYVLELHGILNRRQVKITRFDFGKVIRDEPNAFYYLDPPYYEKGPQLYKHAFNEDSHRRLANLLHGISSDWILSYDDHPFIRDLYRADEIQEVDITYTTARSKSSVRPKNQEVIICPKTISPGLYSNQPVKQSAHRLRVAAA